MVFFHGYWIWRPVKFLWVLVAAQRNPYSLYVSLICICIRKKTLGRDNRWRNLLETYGPRQANLVLITYASSEGSGEPAHPRSLARTFAARSYKHWIKRNLQTENQIPGPSEWLGMRSWNWSWRNARRHKFAWRGPYYFAVINWPLLDLWIGQHGHFTMGDNHVINQAIVSGLLSVKIALGLVLICM